MEIKRSSWHYKISTLGDFESANDNLCCYFWRLVGKSVLIFVVVFLICLLIYTFFTSDLLIANTIMLLFLLSSVALPSFVIRLIRKKFGKSPEMPYGNIAIDYMVAKKRKICPLIRYIW